MYVNKRETYLTDFLFFLIDRIYLFTPIEISSPNSYCLSLPYFFQATFTLYNEYQYRVDFSVWCRFILVITQQVMTRNYFEFIRSERADFV